MELLTALAVGLLFAIGVFQVLRRNVIRSVIGLVILSNGVNLFLLMTGIVDGIDPAYTTATGLRSDALPQALVLTAIVISFGVTAFVLAMLFVISRRYDSCDGDKIDGLKN
jgi:multicomponent Na+:H+ antiporter subunit C